MTPEARSVVVALLRELDAVMDVHGMGKPRGHMLGCTYGMWLTDRPAACSKRCVAAREAIRAARRWLADHADGDAEQMTMEAM